MTFEFPIKNPNDLERELSRPWIYSARHFQVAFGNPQPKGLTSKVNEIGNAAINQIKTASESKSSNLGKRISHFCLGLLELIPIINYIVAIAEAAIATCTKNKEMLNKDVPYNDLPTDEVIERAKQEDIDKIYDLIDVVHELFNSNDIKHSVEGGTLLGAARHRGIIPWDDDGDIVALKTDKKRIEGLKKDLNDKGFDLYYWDLLGIIKVFKKDDKSLKLWTYPSIDVFLIEQDSNGNYVYSSQQSRKYWPKQYFTEKQWNNIQEVEFGHLTVNGLSDEYAEEYCKRAYGETWKSEAYKTHEHTDWVQNPWIVRTRVTSDCARHTKDPKHPDRQRGTVQD